MNIAEYYKQAEFALATYGALTVGTPDIQALKGKDVGMADSQAAKFEKIIGDRPRFSLRFNTPSLETFVCRDVRDYRSPMFRCT